MNADLHYSSFAKGFLIGAPISFGLWALIVWGVLRLLGYA